MATFTVTTVNDVVSAGDGRLSLRVAVAQANATGGAGTIRFAAGIEGRTIERTRGQLQITRDVATDARSATAAGQIRAFRSGAGTIVQGGVDGGFSLRSGDFVL